jgi:hypothetical protein
LADRAQYGTSFAISVPTYPDDAAQRWRVARTAERDHVHRIVPPGRSPHLDVMQFRQPVHAAGVRAFPTGLVNEPQLDVWWHPWSCASHVHP